MSANPWNSFIVVTKENVSDLLHNEMLRLYEAYGPNVKRGISMFAVGRNIYESYLEWGRESCPVSIGMTEFDKRSHLSFHGVPIGIGPLPFILPIFHQGAAHIAYEESRRWVDRLGVGDA